MPSAPRVLIALRPSMYAEVLAFSVGRERPTAEVSILDPSEGVEEAALRLLPHLVVANRVPKTAGKDGPTSSGWRWTSLTRARGPRSASGRG